MDDVGAYVPDGLALTAANGPVEVSATHHVDGEAKAIGYAAGMSNSTNVGAATPVRMGGGGGAPGLGDGEEQPAPATAKPAAAHPVASAAPSPSQPATSAAAAMPKPAPSGAAVAKDAAPVQADTSIRAGRAPPPRGPQGRCWSAPADPPRC